MVHILQGFCAFSCVFICTVMHMIKTTKKAEINSNGNNATMILVIF